MRDAVMVATRAMVGIAARSLAEVSDEVTLAQYRVLVLLDDHGALTMRDLAGHLDVNPSTVTRVVDALVEKGLIERAAQGDDRRSVVAELAPPGRKLLAQVMKRRRALVDATLRRLTPAAQQQLAASLHDFAVAARELADDAWTLGWSN